MTTKIITFRNKISIIEYNYFFDLRERLRERDADLFDFPDFAGFGEDARLERRLPPLRAARTRDGDARRRVDRLLRRCAAAVSDDALEDIFLKK